MCTITRRPYNAYKRTFEYEYVNADSWQASWTTHLDTGEGAGLAGVPGYCQPSLRKDEHTYTRSAQISKGRSYVPL